MASDAWVELPGGDDLPPPPTSGGYGFGFHAAMGRLLRAHPTIGAAFGQLFATVMFGPGSLERAEREMVASVAAAAQDCFY